MRMRLFLAVCLVVAAATPIGAAVPSPVPPFDTTRLYAADAFAAAIKPYQDAIARNADNADAHFWLGVAYLHGARLHRMGFAPYAAGYAGRAVVSLERTLQLRATPVVMVTLLEAYGLAGARGKYDALFDRVGALAVPVPPK